MGGRRAARLAVLAVAPRLRVRCGSRLGSPLAARRLPFGVAAPRASRDTRGGPGDPRVTLNTSEFFL